MRDTLRHYAVYSPGLDFSACAEEPVTGVMAETLFPSELFN
jgi:hypothetical protein